MIILLNSITLALLMLLAYQDFKNREISVNALLILIIITLSKSVYAFADFQISSLLTNLLLISTQLIAIILYIKFSRGLQTKVMDVFLGWGDIALLVAICPAFVPQAFILFILVALLSSILLFLVQKILKLSSQNEIPLAGIIASLFIFSQIFSWLTEFDVFHLSYSLL